MAFTERVGSTFVDFSFNSKNEGFDEERIKETHRYRERMKRKVSRTYINHWCWFILLPPALCESRPLCEWWIDSPTKNGNPILTIHPTSWVGVMICPCEQHSCHRVNRTRSSLCISLLTGCNNSNRPWIAHPRLPLTHQSIRTRVGATFIHSHIRSAHPAIRWPIIVILRPCHHNAP